MLTFIFIILIASNNSNVTLSSLKANCYLEIQYFGMYPEMIDKLNLVCNGNRFTMVHPNNFIQHVNIDTKEKALAHVRFFTTRPNNIYFDIEYYIEIFPESVGQKGHNVISNKIFYQHFKDPTVEEIRNSKICDKDISNAKKSFSIVRYALDANDRIFKIHEMLTEDGYYKIYNKELIENDASKYGIFSYLEQ